MSTDGATRPAPPLDLLRAQRTIRKYLPRIPDPALVRACVEVAQRSPSTSNHQPYCVIDIVDAELRSAVLAEMVCQPYVFEAPTLLLVCVDWSRQDTLARTLGITNEINRSSKLVVGIADASIFAQSLVLALQASGLAASFIASPYTALRRVAELLQVPPDQAMPLHMVSIGYADEAPAPRPRYPLDTLFHTNRFEQAPPAAVAQYLESGSAQLEREGYLAVTGDPVSTWREHYRLKFAGVAKQRTWGPLSRDLEGFFGPASMYEPR